MKEFRLSTASERAAGICFTAVAIAVFAMLVYALRAQTGLMIACGVGVVLIGALLVVYVLGVLRAAIAVDAENKKLHIKGMYNDTVDVSRAVLLQTIARKSGQTTVRVMVFSDAEEQVVAVVPTMFTFRQGMWAEPVAQEMAALLGIEFKRNVPEWQFDRELYKKHVQEEAEQEKIEAKKRREQRMKMRIDKYKKLK